MSDKPDLKTRVEQFNCLRLPGQPIGMHMGTSYLVNDLWQEVKKLHAENLKVSCHCAVLIEVMRDHGISDDAIRAIAAKQRTVA